MNQIRERRCVVCHKLLITRIVLGRKRSFNPDDGQLHCCAGWSLNEYNNLPMNAEELDELKRLIQK